MYCDTCVPAATVIGMRRGAPLPRSSSECAPGLTGRVSGVTPRSTPSMKSWAPGGFVVTISVPSVGTTAAGAMYRRAAGTPAAATATNTAAAASGHHLRVAAGFSLFLLDERQSRRRLKTKSRGAPAPA